MDDKTFNQLKADYEEKLLAAAALNEELTEMRRQINEELDRRKDYPGDVRTFRPRPSNGPAPTDQGSV